jgi:hypothetical protein
MGMPVMVVVVAAWAAAASVHLVNGNSFASTAALPSLSHLALVVEVEGSPMNQGMGIEMASHPCTLVEILNMVAHLPQKMTLLSVSHQHMTQERMVGGIVTGTA